MESTKYKQFPIGWAMMEDISEDASDGWTQSYNDMQLSPQLPVTSSLLLLNKKKTVGNS